MYNKLKSPELYILLALVVTLATSAIFGTYSKKVLEQVTEHSEHAQTDLQNTSDIRFYDEALTNSALLAATSGDPKWEKRYRIFESRLDSLINNVLLHDTLCNLRQMIIVTDSANIRLVEMENRVFDLVRGNKQNEALSIINSSEYAAQKKKYRGGLSAYLAKQELETDQHQELLQQESAYSQWYLGILMVLLSISWIYLAWFLQKDRKFKEKTNQELFREVQVRTASEHALGESLNQIELVNQQLSLLLENAPAMTYSCLAFGNFDATYISPNIKEKLGYDAEEFLKIPGFWAGNIHPDDKERIFAGLSTLFEKGKHQHEYRFRHKNGEWRWMSDSLKLINDENGNPKEIVGYWLDITEKKILEQKITDSNEQFNLVAKATNDCIYDWNMITNRIWWNEALSRHYNYPPEITETDIHWWEDKIHPDDMDALMQSIQKVFDEKLETWSGEYRFRNADGSFAHVFDRGIVLYDKDKNPVRWVGSMMDITKQKQAEAEIIQAKEKLQESINASGVGLWDWNLQTNEVYQSLEWKKQIGYEDDEVSASTEFYFSHLHPEDIPIINEQSQKLLEGALEKLELEYRFLHKDGSYRWMYSRASVKRDQNGKPLRMLGSHLDITERKQAEEKITMLVQAIKNTAECIGIADKDFNFVFVNESFLKTYGFSEDEVIGQPIAIIHSENNPAEINNELFSSLAKNQSWKGEVLNKRKDGTEFPVLLTVTPFLNEKGELIGSVGITKDITEQKLKETEILNMNATLELKVAERTAQLLKAKDEAEAANRSKSEFFSRTSHELRTPLNAILGFAQLMEMGDLKPAHKKGIEGILKGGKRLLSLVNDVLELSRVETGQLSISLEPVRIGSVISETIEAVLPFAAERNITLEFAESPENQLFVKADLQKLKKALLNLMNNAVRFNRKDGSVRVEVRSPESGDRSQKTEVGRPEIKDGIEKPISNFQYPISNIQSSGQTTRNTEPGTRDPEPATLRITVTDTGIGIAPDQIAKLFKPFERIETEVVDFVGTGVGLAVSKKLIEAMNGTIGVESEFGVGSTFWIELPQAENQNDFHEQKGDFIKPEPESVVAGTILYIEDNQSNIELVEGILESQRPSVRLISEMFGMNTVKLAIENQPSLILLDLDLPDIHGSKVLKLLQAEPATATIPVVVISADAQDTQIEKLMQSGVRNYLVKPINVVEFLNVVDEVMKG